MHVPPGLAYAAVLLPVLAAVAAWLGFRGSDVQLGVDLGTSFSAAAYSDGGGAWIGAAAPAWAASLGALLRRAGGGAAADALSLSSEASSASAAARVVTNLDGEATTPSVVAIEGGAFLVGRRAVAHLESFPHEGVLDGKRVIGRRRGDATVAAEAQRHGGRLMLHPHAFRSAGTGRPASAAVVGSGGGALSALAALLGPLASRIAESRVGRALGLASAPGGFSAGAPAWCADCERELAFAIPLLRQTEREARALAAHPCVDAGSLVELEAAGGDGGSGGGDDELSDSPAALAQRLRRLAARLGGPRFFLLLTPQAAACVLLSYLRESASRALPYVSLSSATACVPAEFDAVQRRATLEAFSRAGLRVARTLHEPTAAAAAYGLHKRADVHYVLVFDMGGGTLDVSVLFLGEGAFTVIGTAGDNGLGGEDFDDCLGAEMLRGAAAAAAANNSPAPLCAPEALNLEAERVKLALGREERVEWSSAAEAGAGGGSRCAGVVTRVDFERACAPLFDRSVAPVVQALDNANVKAAEVDELVLVGGSSRLLAVRRRLQAHFGGRELRTTVDPDLAVALGAAASRV